MFTGIIEQTAKVTGVSENESGIRLTVQCLAWKKPVQKGESISVAGCCLTVTNVNEMQSTTFLKFDVIPETLNMTTLSHFSEGTDVNIERAMRADSFLGGHIVQGHIDGIAIVLQVDDFNGGECRLRIDTSDLNQTAIISKGSIAIDGVSLTIASKDSGWLEVALIPTTLQTTTLGEVVVGQSLNIETDMLARTAASMIEAIKQPVE